MEHQMLLEALYKRYRIGEITAPSVYTKESSTINFKRSVVYGFGVLWTAVQYVLQKCSLGKFGIFAKDGKKLTV